MLTGSRFLSKNLPASTFFVRQFLKLGDEVAVECGAGVDAHYSDQSYADASGEMLNGAAQLWASPQILLNVCVPEHHLDLDVYESRLRKAGKNPVVSNQRSR